MVWTEGVQQDPNYLTEDPNIHLIVLDLGTDGFDKSQTPYFNRSNWPFLSRLLELPHFLGSKFEFMLLIALANHEIEKKRFCNFLWILSQEFNRLYLEGFRCFCTCIRCNGKEITVRVKFLYVRGDYPALGNLLGLTGVQCPYACARCEFQGVHQFARMTHGAASSEKWNELEICCNNLRNLESLAANTVQLEEHNLQITRKKDEIKHYKGVHTASPLLALQYPNLNYQQFFAIDAAHMVNQIWRGLILPFINKWREVPVQSKYWREKLNVCVNISTF